MKRNLKILGTIFFIGIAIFSCSPSTPTPVPTAGCNIVGTDFQQLYTATLASNVLFTNNTTMDLVTHEYTFTVNTNQTACTVGYQGNATLYTNSIPYTIEIYNNTTATLVYSGSHIFNSAATDYQSITPTNLVAGNSYTIKRIASNYLGNIGNTVGRILKFNTAPVPYPVTFGALTITSSDFYGTGGPVPNFGIPYIDIVFQ